MIWNESIECMDRESLRKIQSIRLKKTVERVYPTTVGFPVVPEDAWIRTIWLIGTAQSPKG